MMDGTALHRPRLGFVGLGWIGRNRLEGLARSGRAEIVGLADPDPEAVALSAADLGASIRGDGLEDILALEPDGVVIATPSALHAAQTIRALEAGVAVFCQKPLGRDAGETTAAVEAARRAGKLLATDLCYRETAAVRAISDLVRSGELGEIYSVDLTFHNAYGPDKPWFRDPALSGGGCLIDLGVHLVDLALWMLDWPGITCLSQILKSGGETYRRGNGGVEDLALATLLTDRGAAVRLACSWNLPVGLQAMIRMDVFGTKGGASISNCDGSYFDFEARRHDGCNTHHLVTPPDDWSARAALAWLDRLAGGTGFDPECQHLVAVAETLDLIYDRAG